MASIVELRGPSSPRNKPKSRPAPTKLPTPSRRTLGNIRIAKSSSLPPIDSTGAHSSEEADDVANPSQTKDSSTLVEVRADISRIKTMITSGRTPTLPEYDYDINTNDILLFFKLFFDLL